MSMEREEVKNQVLDQKSIYQFKEIELVERRFIIVKKRNGHRKKKSSSDDFKEDSNILRRRPVM